MSGSTWRLGPNGEEIIEAGGLIFPEDVEMARLGYPANYSITPETREWAQRVARNQRRDAAINRWFLRVGFGGACFAAGGLVATLVLR